MTHIRHALGAVCCLVAIGAISGCNKEKPGSIQPALGPFPNKYDLDCTDQGNECWVPVTVTASGSQCEISVIYKLVVAKKNVKIIWYLNQTGYEFDESKGIDIAQGPPGQADPPFESPGRHVKDWQFKWHSTGKKAGTEFPYTLNVRLKGATAPCTTADPVIKNT